MRRLLRFNLKVLFAFVTVFSIWLGLHVQGAREQKKAVQLIREHHGWVAYDYQIADGNFDASAVSSVPAWLRQPLGDDFFHTVAEVSFHLRWDDQGAISVSMHPDALPLRNVLAGVPKIRCLRLWGTQVTDDNLQAVAELSSLESLIIVEGVNVTDKGAAHLGSLKRLQWLVLTESQITDTSLQVFSTLRNLKVLNLEARQLTDDGLRYLSSHQRLQTLFVNGQNNQANGIGDNGIMSLCSIPNLTFLSVVNTRVTANGIGEFTAKCPGCKIQSQ